jgi:hypothetical protein
MPAVAPVFGEHTGLHLSYTPVEPMVGGQLLERRAGVRKVGVADAGTLRFAGVAFHDVKATKETPTTVVVDKELGQTAWRGCVIPVTYAAAATAGDKLKAAALGQVTPFEEDDDPRCIIGECEETIASTGVARARIY